MWNTTVACRCWWLDSQWREGGGLCSQGHGCTNTAPLFSPWLSKQLWDMEIDATVTRKRGTNHGFPLSLSFSWSSLPSFFSCHSFYLSQPPLSKRTWSILQNKQWPISTLAKAEKVQRLCRGKTKIILQGASNDTLVVTKLWICLSFLATKAKKDM